MLDVTLDMFSKILTFWEITIELNHQIEKLIWSFRGNIDFLRGTKLINILFSYEGNSYISKEILSNFVNKA